MTQAVFGCFDQLSESYDRYRIGYASEVYDALAEAGVHKGARVLDVACGTGLVSRALVERGCTVTGLDASQPMLERARTHVPGSAFIAGCAEALPFADAAFDASVSAQAFHWFDQPRALTEMQRVVRAGGTIAIWWKGLMRGDATRFLREQTVRDLGLTPPTDLLCGQFSAFEDSSLLDRKLRVIPWIVRMRVADYLGYERSRARARDAYGDALETYLTRLESRLGQPEEELSLGYLHLVYLGRVPASVP